MKKELYLPNIDEIKKLKAEITIMTESESFLIGESRYNIDIFLLKIHNLYRLVRFGTLDLQHTVDTNLHPNSKIYLSNNWKKLDQTIQLARKYYE